MLEQLTFTEQFAADGYVAGIPISTPVEVRRFRALFDKVEAIYGRERCQNGLFDPHFQWPFVWELATHERVLDRIESLLGPNILLMGSHFFCKYGPSEAFVAWHQDVTYWGLEPPRAVSAWYAIDDSDRDNGCLQVIPGSHLGGIRTHGTSHSASRNLLSVNQALSVSDEQLQQVVNVELSAGEISLHDGLAIHGSLANESTRRRCGLAMIYLPTSVRQASENSLGTRWSTVLVRGENRERHFSDLPRPFASATNLPPI